MGKAALRRAANRSLEGCETTRFALVLRSLLFHLTTMDNHDQVLIFTHETIQLRRIRIPQFSIRCPVSGSLPPDLAFGRVERIRCFLGAVAGSGVDCHSTVEHHNTQEEFRKEIFLGRHTIGQMVRDLTAEAS